MFIIMLMNLNANKSKMIVVAKNDSQVTQLLTHQVVRIGQKLFCIALCKHCNLFIKQIRLSQGHSAPRAIISVSLQRV
jgi:hypothetical protein